MLRKKSTKIRRLRGVFAGFLVLIGMFTGFSQAIIAGTNAYADPQPGDSIVSQPEDADLTTENRDNNQPNNDNNDDGSDATSSSGSKTNVCKKSLGALGWIICPLINKTTEAVDWLYEKIESILTISPIEAKEGSPIYEIWKYCRSVTNIVFIIFLLVVIYSQITGLGINNYGIKKVLPKLIVMAILVNLSFLICTLAVDVSNIVGNGLRSVFTAVEQTALANMAGANATTNGAMAVSMAETYTAFAGGTALAIGAGAVALTFDLGVIWMLIPTALGALAAVVTGLITIALRQAVVMLLVMISPLALVANILPNTEQLFQKWKKLLTRMLVFYPLFSLLFGASSLAGFAIIMSSRDGFGLLLGLAVQIFPLIFSWKMMQMSGTILGEINTRLRALTARPIAANRAWADSHRQLTNLKRLDNGRMPSARLMQFLSNRKIAREEEMSELAESAKLRGQAYAARKNYRRNGLPSREGEEAYARQARNMRYMQETDRHKNNMNMGLGQLEVVKAKASKAQKVRLDRLDLANVEAADKLKVEKARGEKIEYENAKSFHKRMEDAMNVHFDDINRGKSDYKTHDIKDVASARARYTMAHQIMEGDLQGIHYAAASAAQGYDTQKKIVETKMQKYFDLTPPTKDVEYRLGELTADANAISNVDSIISGLRVLNQRGDTDLVKKYMEQLLSHNVQLGTHASQALASFLMFEVKDNDPWLRRFGKYINLETATVYNENKRKVMEVNYDEYIKGYHDGEPITAETPNGRMYAKKGMRQLSEGTSLDNIERTALSNLDDSIKKAYGYDSDHPEKKWDVSGWLKKREEIQTAFEPAFLSASLKWLSGSEQINSGVKFWTGYELKQKKDSNGNLIVDENDNPEYDLTPIWKRKEFAGHEDEVEAYYRRKTGDYFKDQTTGQILGMRTDYRDAAMEHMLETYLSGSEERRSKYEEARAEIQSRYGDEEPAKAEKMRAKDLKALKMELAGRQVRKILGETGKLKQIYRTRTSGTAINAKDWLRKWVNLDNEEALREEMNYYDKKNNKNKKSEGAGADSDSADGNSRVYTEDDCERFLAEMQDLKDRIMDEETDAFFGDTMNQLADWFGDDTEIVKKYQHYYQQDRPYADNIELYGYLKELLGDLGNYPDA